MGWRQPHRALIGCVIRTQAAAEEVGFHTPECAASPEPGRGGVARASVGQASPGPQSGVMEAKLQLCLPSGETGSL